MSTQNNWNSSGANARWNTWATYPNRRWRNISLTRITGFTSCLTTPHPGFLTTSFPFLPLYLVSTSHACVFVIVMDVLKLNVNRRSIVRNDLLSSRGCNLWLPERPVPFFTAISQRLAASTEIMCDSVKGFPHVMQSIPWQCCHLCRSLFIVWVTPRHLSVLSTLKTC